MAGLTTPVALRNLFTKLYSTFDEVGVPGNLSSLDEIILRVPSTSKYNTYGFLDGFPKFREWIGQRAVRGLSQRVYQIYNKDYEDTIGIDRDTFDDAQLIDAQLPVRLLAEASKQLPFDLVIDLLRNGHARVGYDGQNFFDTDHPTNIDNVTGTQSNYRTSFALTRTNFITARADMMKWSGASGRVFGSIPRLLIVPPELEQTALDIVAPGVVAVGGVAINNTLSNAARVVVIPELSVDATTWYLADPSGALKPLILQERQAPRFVSKTNPSDDNMFWHKEYIFGADARYGAGYGAWFKILKAVA
jgi:phage major head subunit gpT-like protein